MSKISKVGDWSLLMLSAGIDSTALLFSLLEKGKLISGVFLDQGQLCAMRQEAAIRKVAIDYHFPLHISRLAQTLDLSLPILNMPYHRQTEHAGGPTESCRAITICGLLAANYGARHLYYGVTTEDREIIPNLEEMVGHIQAAVRLNSGKPHFSIETPFSNLTRAETLKLLYDIDSSVITWSCHWGNEFHCGKCDGCKVRKRRYADAGIRDETVYME